MRFIDLKILVKFEKEISENWDYSSAFRGIFGRILKKTYCLQKNIECNSCVFDNCIYYMLFEKKYDNTISFRPYIIRHDHSSSEKNSILLEFKLIGTLTEYFDQIAFVLIKLQKHHLLIRGKKYFFRIEKIVDKNTNNEIFNSEEGKILKINPQKILYDFPKFNHLKINFVTPLRMKYKNKLMNNFNFEAFINSLHKRLLFLNENFGDNDLVIPVPSYEGIVVEKKQFVWKEFYRKSYRQHQKMSLGGIIGYAVLKNVDEKTFINLKLGEIFHAGKQTAFGMGKYLITEVK